MRIVGRGIQEFEKIRGNNQFYVDKTGFIADWYRSNDDITLITRPRRFGKTLTIDMLNSFFSTTHADRTDLFEGLDISRDRQMMSLQGTVPTIKISFAGIKGESFRGFLMSMAGRIAMLFDRYRYLLEEDILDEGEKKVFAEMARVVPDIPNPETDFGHYEKYLYRLTHI